MCYKFTLASPIPSPTGGNSHTKHNLIKALILPTFEVVSLLLRLGGSAKVLHLQSPTGPVSPWAFFILVYLLPQLLRASSLLITAYDLRRLLVLSFQPSPSSIFSGGSPRQDPLHRSIRGPVEVHRRSHLRRPRAPSSQHRTARATQLSLFNFSPPIKAISFGLRHSAPRFPRSRGIRYKVEGTTGGI